MVINGVLGLPEAYYVRVPLRSHVNHEDDAITTSQRHSHHNTFSYRGSKKATWLGLALNPSRHVMKATLPRV
jgi:hypothetical protein